MSLQFDIQIAGIETDNIAKIYKDRESEIQKILDKSSNLELSIKGLDVKALNEELTKTKTLLDKINKSSLSKGTPLQRAKADVVYREAEAKATMLQKKYTDELSISRDRANVAAKNSQTAEERLTQAKLRTENAQNRQLNATKKQTAAWTANRSAMNGIPQFLSAYVSLLGGIRLFNNIKQITAEFELQKVALKAITQEAEFSAQLFEKIKATAIMSPFTTKDLVTYAKQLAAFRIENENLYDTLNKLADVSAGLGVDMDRLILAYGQVKAASVLRGQELRQFTEAGIPLVAMLAEKFTELRGETVSTAEVFDLISKRAVSFEMVAGLFDDMTEAGGKFYNMQKIQSESLFGVYANLKDNIEIAFNDIGQRQRGVLMGLGKLGTKLAQDLDSVVGALLMAGTAFGVYKGNMALAARTTGLLTKAQAAESLASLVQATAVKTNSREFKMATVALKLYTNAQLKLSTALGILKNALKSISPLTIATAVITGLVVVIRKLTEANREAKKALKEMTAEYEDKIKAVKSYTLALKDVNEMEIDESEKLQRRAEIMEDLAEIDSDYAQTIKDKITDTKSLTTAENEYVNTLNARLTVEKSLIETGTILYADIYTKAVNRQNDALRELNSNYGYNIQVANELMESGKLSAKSFELVSQFIEGVNIDNYEEKLKGLKKAIKDTYQIGYSGRLAGAGQDLMSSFNFEGLNDVTRATNRANNATTALTGSFTELFQTMRSEAKVFEATRELASVWESLKINPNDPELNKRKVELENSLVEMFDTALSSKGVDGAAKEAFGRMFEVEMGFAFEKSSLPAQALLKWQKVFKTYTEGLQEQTQHTLPKLESAEQTQADMLSKVTDEYKSAAEEFERMSRADVAITDPKDLADMKLWVDLLRQQMEYLGGINDTTTGGGKADTTALDNELSLLKEVYAKYKELREYKNEATSKQAIRNLYNMEIDEQIYLDALDNIMRRYAALGEDKKTLEIGLEIKDISFDKLIEQFKGQLEELSVRANMEDTAQDFFEKMLGLTGDIEYSTQVTLDITGIMVRGVDVKKALEDRLMEALTEISADGVSVKIPTELKVNGEFDVKKTLEFIQSLPPEQKKSAEEIFKIYQEYLKNSAASLIEFYNKVDELSRQDFNLFGSGATFDISKIASEAITEYKNIEKARLDMITELNKSSANLSEEEYQMELANINKLYEKQKEYQKKLFQEKLSDTAAAIVTESINTAGLDMIIEDLGDKTLRQIRKARKQLEEMSGKEILTVSPETMQLLEQQGVVIDQLKDTDLEGIFGAVGESIPDTEQMILRLLQQVQKGELDLTQLQEKIKQLFGAKIKNLTEEEFKKLTNNISEAISSISEITALISEFADEIGDSGLKSDVESFSGSMELLGSVFQGIAAGGWIGAVIAAVTWLAKNTVGTFLDIKLQTEKLKQATYQYNEELRKAAINTDLLGEKYDTIFGENAWGKFTLDLTAYTNAVKAYNSVVRETSMDPQSLLKDRMDFTEDERFDPNFMNTYIKGVQRGLNSIEAMAVKTKDYNWFGEKFFAKQDKYTSLYDLAPDLFNKDGSVNTSALETLLKEYDAVLTQQQKNLLNELLTNSQMYEQAQKETFEYLESLFGDTASTISESMVTAFVDSGNAAIDFGDVMAGVAKKMAQDIVTSLVFDGALMKYQEQIKAIMTDTGLTAEEKATQALALFKAAMGEVENMTPEIQAFLDGVKEYFGGETNLTGISKDIAGITEQTALALGALGNNMIYQTVGMRTDVAAIRSILESKSLADMGENTTLVQIQQAQSEGLAQLRAINGNTARTANACEELTTTIKNVTSVSGARAVKNFNVQIVG